MDRPMFTVVAEGTVDSVVAELERVPAGMTLEYGFAIGGPVYDYRGYAVQRYLAVVDGEFASWNVFGKSFATVDECRNHIDSRIAEMDRLIRTERESVGLVVWMTPPDNYEDYGDGQ